MNDAIDTVLFDFFGVIFADPLKSWLEKRSYVKDERHEETARLLDTGKISYDQYVDRLADISGELAKDLHTEFRSSMLLNNPLVSTIARLKQTYRIGLLSNTCPQEINPLLEDNDLVPLFDKIVISSETGLAKPDPEIFTLTLDRLSAHPGRTIFIDDSERNIGSARSLGIQSVRYEDMDQLHTRLSDLGVSLDLRGAL